MYMDINFLSLEKDLTQEEETIRKILDHIEAIRELNRTLYAHRPEFEITFRSGSLPEAAQNSKEPASGN